MLRFEALSRGSDEASVTHLEGGAGGRHHQGDVIMKYGKQMCIMLMSILSIIVVSQREVGWG